MSSTNKTTNYNLSQFIGTDKPAWLADYNQDMGKIDAQMKLNADSATGADGKADANATSIGTLANLTTDAKTNLVSAINEVDSHADTAQGTANNALSSATTANTGVSNLSDYLNIDTFIAYSGSDVTLTGSGSIRYGDLHVARNDEGSLGKIYGNVILDTTANQEFTITIPNTGFSTSESFTVQNAGFITLENSNGTLANVDALSYNVNTNGSVTVTYRASTPVTVLRFVACLVFIKNFGD